jgi:hypothetical protein
LLFCASENNREGSCWKSQVLKIVVGCIDEFFFIILFFFLLAFVKLLKSTKEETGSNDRIGKWFSSGLTVYVCVGYPVEGK